jgi:poly-gamma-glutamate synthesis protein (capsule biosynthesis protein)
VLAGGDVALGRALGQKILAEPDYDPFVHVRPLLASADVRFVNLESQLSDQPGGRTVHANNYLVFTGPGSGARTLANAGIDVVSLANNHAWDFGKSALFQTIDHLSEERIRFTGASKTRGALFRPAVLEVKGFSIAVFAVTQIWNQPPFEEHPGRFHVAWADIQAVKRAVADAREQHDIVLLSYHGQAEYIERPLPAVRRFVEAALRSGVDAVIGHHPHVPRGIQFHEGRPAFYSLGNFVFEPWISPWARVGMLARLTFQRGVRGRPVQVEVCPFEIEGRDLPVPRPFTQLTDNAEQRRTELRARLSKTSRDLESPITVGPESADGCWPVAPPEASD